MKFIPIAYPLVFLLDVFMFINFWNWQHQSVYEFEQRQMDLQVNYAVDASVHDMLYNGTHLNTDYADWGNMTTEPEVTLDTYVAVLLRNIGWSDTEQNRMDLIDGSIPFFCVATYDGYYMYCKQQDHYSYHLLDGTEEEIWHYPMIWTPKIPYSETIVINQMDGIFEYNLYNLGFETYTRVWREDDGSGSYNGNMHLDMALPLAKSGGASGSVSMARSVINNTLTDACNSALYLGLENSIDKSWYLPATFSQWSNNNPVESPTVLTYLNRTDGHTQYSIVTFGIGGAKITDAEFCICYTDPSYGGKLYTWSTNREELKTKYGITNIEYVFSTAKEAAENGYFFDLRFREGMQ